MSDYVFTFLAGLYFGINSCTCFAWIRDDGADIYRKRWLFWFFAVLFLFAGVPMLVYALIGEHWKRTTA